MIVETDTNSSSSSASERSKFSLDDDIRTHSRDDRDKIRPEMSTRLASFRGPSTPSSSPVKTPQSPGSPHKTRPTESTYHRKLRASLQELRATCRTWDDLVRKDGLRAIRELVDARTDLEFVSYHFFCGLELIFEQ